MLHGLKKFGGQLSFLLLGLMVTNNGWAFKLKSHVFVGQQVINDLADDGNLTFEINNNFYDIPVSEEVSSAILENQSAYLFGNIGPDAAPDFVVGQTSVHPGALGKNEAGDVIEELDSSRYHTDDWLKYLLTKKEISNKARAYIYGYLSHASADVFAHTYVNQYSGDIFELGDGEQLNEKRHIALESYIDSKVPVLRDYQGIALGAPYQRINLEDDDLFEFLRDELIYADIPTEQYAKNSYALHLVAISNLREQLRKQANDEYGYWHAIDVWVLQLVAKIKYDIDVSDELASDLVDIGNVLIDEVNVGVDQIQSISDKLLGYRSDFENFGFDSVTSAMDKLQSSQDSLTDKRQELEKAVLDWRTDLAVNGCEYAIDTIDPAGILETAIELDPFAGLLGIDGVEDAIEWSIDPLGILDIFGDDDPYVYTIGEENISASDLYSDYALDWARESGRSRVLSDFIYNSPGFTPEDIAAILNDETTEFADYASPYHREVVDSLVEMIRDSIIPPFILIGAGDVLSPILINTTEYNWSVKFSDGIITSILVTESESGKEVISINSNKISSDDGGLCEDLSKAVNAADYALLNAIHELEDDVNQQAQQNIDDAKAAYEKLKEVEDNLNATVNALIDLWQLLESDMSPIQSVFSMWQSSVDTAMTEYTRTTATMMVNTMDESASSVDPLADWVACYGPTLIGVPSQACEVWQNVNGMVDALSDVLSILDNAPIPVDLRVAREALRGKSMG
ncbi:zinc dependent phospholipase C family protein [Microbulbifer sp. VAAF005]|uniref:zinc dependent phospholipase C family protein n=1 Tax=Microbulbifer sp. VAAF005 TaxID=3034230 RepID=UPI0024AE4D24|nr:zinc dependent phospholipase C family protein [Microbulbifer sp. VAAF005]WHI44773.1 zinc dependent phospholipase C family protein [Microbulbifer sp. VAAF005]